ncbi:MAG: beta-phosphoglucomutase [Clostridia bacterium]|nr:beta-phosphoglucomutase [Clostridia bacterium]
MIQAVIFNLDGVLVNSDECQFAAWRQLAHEQGIPFDEKINGSMQGMKRMESLRVLLRKAERRYTMGEMFALSARKNDIFNELILTLGPENICPGAVDAVEELREIGIKTAVGSCSENATGILRQLKMDRLFDVIVDGGQITKGKPDPEVFLLAADQMEVPPENCLVVEDGRPGVEAARRCGMQVLAIGDALSSVNADYWAESVRSADLPDIIRRDYVRTEESKNME